MQRLELTWIGKGEEPVIEPRILLHDATKDYGESNSGNMLIHGDNLLALKALEQEYAGKVKCIYIDPPYNTSAACSSYDDNLEHSVWLNLMKPRIELLKCLLSEDGIMCVQIDDSPNSVTGQSSEKAYLQILIDEIFGRKNYIADLVWKKKGNPGNTAGTIGTITESIFVYAKDKKQCRINRQSFEKTYKYTDGIGPYNLETFLKTDQGAYKRDTMKFEIVDATNGKKYLPPEGQRWTYGKTTIDELNRQGLLVFKNNRVYVKKYRKGDDSKLYNNLLLEHGSLKSAKEELVSLGFSRESFETPKPEILLESILNMFSDPGDLVLDSFLGSGTTAAVAEKMGRKWIGIELGDHAYTHCYKRLKAVVDGEQGGISKEVNWKGGGGFKFYELAPTLITKDKYGNPVFSEKYNDVMLVAAVSKINGFFYAPDSEIFWKQGYSRDNSFIYVTTQYLTAEVLDGIAAELSPMENLLVCASAFDIGLSKRYDNIQVQKIPRSVLEKCEYGVDNYNLNIVDVPECSMEDWEDD